MNRILPLLVLIAACAPTPSTQPAAMPSPDGPDPATPTAEAPATEAPLAANAADRHREVHWVRTAAEYRALALQVYRSAWQAVRGHSADLAPGTWAVIMDADETVLDNSEFERRIAEAGVEFQEPMWDEWVFEEDAGLVPGAAWFIDRVQDTGGRVAIVTNRDARLCPATERNLRALGIRPAVVLCETDTGEKEPRFRMVEEGTASDTLPPLVVVAWIGDNIGDFPGFDQSDRTDVLSTFRLFGSRYFVLPNPMYGSWMSNEWR